MRYPFGVNALVPFGLPQHESDEREARANLDTPFPGVTLITI
jgi:hypothetical protein